MDCFICCTDNSQMAYFLCCIDAYAEAGATHDPIFLQAVALRGDPRTGQGVLAVGIQLETQLFSRGEIRYIGLNAFC